MKTKILPVIFFITGLACVSAQIAGQPPSLSIVREQYFKMTADKNAPLTLYFRLKPYDLSSNAILLAYRGAAGAASAGAVSGVYNKLKYFSAGKEELEQAVKSAPSDPEIRFLRLATQLNAPGFLGYNSNRADDKALIIKAMRNAVRTDSNSYLYSHLADFLLDSGFLSKEEQGQVNQFKAKWQKR
jgi:hypothetical protein